VQSLPCYEGEFLRVTLDRAVDPAGYEIKRLIVHHHGSAVILPVDSKGRILLVRQYRLAARKYLWELPAGRIEDGERPLDAAKRELAEETGYQAGEWTRIASFYPSPGFLSEKMSVYVARELETCECEPDFDEHISSRWFTLKTLSGLIEKGKLEDGKTLVGVMAWQNFSAKQARKAPRRNGPARNGSARNGHARNGNGTGR